MSEWYAKHGVAEPKDLEDGVTRDGGEAVGKDEPPSGLCPGSYELGDGSGYAGSHPCRKCGQMILSPSERIAPHKTDGVR